MEGGVAEPQGQAEACRLAMGSVGDRLAQRTGSERGWLGPHRTTCRGQGGS